MSDNNNCLIIVRGGMTYSEISEWISEWLNVRLCGLSLALDYTCASALERTAPLVVSTFFLHRRSGTSVRLDDW